MKFPVFEFARADAGADDVAARVARPPIALVRFDVP